MELKIKSWPGGTLIATAIVDNGGNTIVGGRIPLPDYLHRRHSSVPVDGDVARVLSGCHTGQVTIYIHTDRAHRTARVSLQPEYSINSMGHLLECHTEITIARDSLHDEWTRSDERYGADAGTFEEQLEHCRERWASADSYSRDVAGGAL